GERIVSAAEAPLPDLYEQPRHALDVSLRFPLFASVSAKLDVKNLLDSRYEVTQGTVVRERYRTGRVFSAGVTWESWRRRPVTHAGPARGRAGTARRSRYLELF